MKTKLVQTEDYLLFIDANGTPIVGQFHYDFNSENHVEMTYDFTKQTYHRSPILAYTLINPEAKELDLPLLLNPFDSLNRRKFIYLVKNTKGGEKGNFTFEVIRFECLEEAEEWCKGKSHLEIEQQEMVVSQSKQFSLEDIQKAIEMARDYIAYMKFGEIKVEFDGGADKIIQSLSTKQYPKEFIPEYYCTGTSMEEDMNCPCFEMEGNKCKFKTITNSEGKQQLVGTYKW